LNRTKLNVPPALMRPTTSSASVIRPCASSPAVTARRRMARRPPQPITAMPTVVPATSPSDAYQT
jgi:hypothetical protein